MPLTVNIMTAALAPGDAIGNYILTQRRILREMGFRVRLYADNIHPDYAAPARVSRLYFSFGDNLLWYHYSIGTPNLQLMAGTADRVIMDYHGISPPALFGEMEPSLAALCQQGRDWLPKLRGRFALHVVHSDYARQELIQHGYDPTTIHKLPLVVDAQRLRPQTITPLAGKLAQIEYLLFVGRVVPQKDVLRLLEIFAAVYRQRPQVRLLLVGSRDQTAAYQRQLDAFVAEQGLETAVHFTGQINSPSLLAELMRHARYLVVTSAWESFCVPLIEAMHFGVPPIIHNLPPLPEIAAEAGILIDKQDIAQAAETILHHLDNPSWRIQLAEKAQHRAQAFTDTTLRHDLRALWGLVVG